MNFATVAGLVFGAIGFFPRISLAMSGILIFIVEWAVSSNLRTNAPNSPLFVLFLLILCAKAFEKSLVKKSPKSSSAGGGGIELAVGTCLAIELVLPMAYLNAGLSKFINGGISWLNGESFSGYLYFIFLESGVESANYFSNHLNLCVLLAALTMIFEVGFVAIVFSAQRVRNFLVIAALLFHLGVLYLMWINFLWMYLPIYFVYVRLPDIYRMKGGMSLAKS